MTAFWDGFEKRANNLPAVVPELNLSTAKPSLTHRASSLGTGMAVGGAAGALLGGERGQDGKVKNRGIGALRGAAAIAGSNATSQAAHHYLLPHLLKHNPSHPLLNAAGLTGLAALGGYAGYKAMKRLGPKYEREQASQRKENVK